MGMKPVHPRGHGEHIVFYSETAVNARFIPVGTGNTLNTLLVLKINPVHPRGHGEHTNDLTISLSTDGSSPWARGTPTAKACKTTTARFIPVGTGNTLYAACFQLTQPVHPRGHGEHATFGDSSVKTYGSSPWARGTRNLIKRFAT